MIEVDEKQLRLLRRRLQNVVHQLDQLLQIPTGTSGDWSDLPRTIAIRSVLEADPDKVWRPVEVRDALQMVNRDDPIAAIQAQIVDLANRGYIRKVRWGAYQALPIGERR